jgi:hypothetical protein
LALLQAITDGTLRASRAAKREARRQLPAWQRKTDSRGRYPDGHLERVAEEYAKAVHEGGAKATPTKAVAERFGISRSAAAKQIRRARDKGLIGETENRKAGGVAPAAKKATKSNTRKGR